MKYIGNIVVSSPNLKIDGLFKRCLSIEDAINELPTLIVGLENARQNIQGFNILYKKYNKDNLWWTFSKSERRSIYDSDMEEFYKFCIQRLLQDLRYTFLDVVNMKYSTLKRLLNFVNGDYVKQYFIDNNKFIFIKYNGRFFGISLNTLAFYGIDKSSVIGRFKKNKHNQLIKNFFSIPNNIKNFVGNDIPKQLLLLDYFT